MDFGGGNPANMQINSATIAESMKVMRMQVEQQQQELLLQYINEKCFKMCVPSPGSSLDNSQQKCLAKCTDRYVEAWNAVSKSITNRLRNHHNMN